MDVSVSGNCRELFSIIEDRHVETVTNCGSTERSAMVYVSHSNSIQIQFATNFRNAGSNTEEDQPHFLIHYEGKQHIGISYASMTKEEIVYH